MKITAKCKFCKAPISKRTNLSNRIDYAIQKGENIHCTCKKCTRSREYHINDFWAEESALIKIINVLILVSGGALIWYLVSNYNLLSHPKTTFPLGIIAIGISGFAIKLWQDDIRRVSHFNSELFLRKTSIRNPSNGT